MLALRWLLLSLCLLPVAILSGMARAEPAAKSRPAAGVAVMRPTGQDGATVTSAFELLSANDRSVRLPAGQVQAAAQKTEPRQVRTPSIVEMLEGRENELIVGAAVAAAFFIVGWICGGNYYVRRERKQRNKIRF
jgi:hypothetical protein